MMIGVLLLWGALIALALWGVGILFPSGRVASKAQTARNALDILAERYARGEISRDEFDKIKRDISAGGELR